MQTSPDKRASGKRGSARKEDEMNEEDPTQGVRDWSKPFTENLEDLETHVPAHPSEREISDSEGDASKVVIQKRKHRIYTHFTRDRNCDICLTTKLRGFVEEGAMRDLIPRAEKVW